MSIQDSFDAARGSLTLTESEETWDTILRAINKLSAACADADAYTPSELVTAVRPFFRPIISAMNSERGRLSGAALDLVAVFASSLGVAFDPLLHHFFPVLLALSARTSKVTLTRARACIQTVISSTLLPSILSYLLQSASDKSVSLRLTVAEAAVACLNCFNPPDLEKDSKAKEVEAMIRVASRDASADIRKVGRKMFEAYQQLLPTRVERFVAPLSPTTRKYLDIAAKPKTLAPPLSKNSHLSSSTSNMPSKSTASTQTKSHARSASSPAVGPAVPQAPPKAERAKRAEPVQPQRAPEPIPPSRTIPHASTSGNPERKRVVSTAFRPTRQPKADVDERPPVPSSNTTSTQPMRRAPQPAGPAVAPATGPQRILVSESTKPIESATRPRVVSVASLPAIRAAPAPPPPRPVVAKAGARSAPTAAGTRAIAGKKAALSPTKPPKTASRHKEPAKSSLMKPTLAQLARAKVVERRVAAVSSGAPSKPEKRVSRKAPLPSLPQKKSKPAPPSQKEGPQLKGEEEKEQAAVEDMSEPMERDVEAEKEQGDNEERDEEGAAEEEASPEETETAAEAAEQEEHASPSPVPEVTVDGPASGFTTPQRTAKTLDISGTKTPISELLLSIEQGFLFTPNGPLSPPNSYLPLATSTNALGRIPFPGQAIWPSTSAESLKPFEPVRRRTAFGTIEINK